MKIKYKPEDAAQGKPVPQEAAQLLSAIQPRLNGLGGADCRLTFYARKFRKVLAEFDVCDQAGKALTHCFAKSYDSRQANQTFATLSTLTQAGFCPPSRYTVTRPLAYLEDRQVVVVEKAPGEQLTEILFERSGDSAEAIRAAAGWLRALHSSSIRADTRRLHVEGQIRRFGNELVAALPKHAGALRAIQRRLSALCDSQPEVPSHRDFHPDNIFIAPDGRVTLIDLDQFGMQEPAGDVAYFSAQMAIMSYLRTGTFATTAAARHTFLSAYAENSPHTDPRRLALHFAFAFLKSLHYELCVFHTNNARIIEPWLAAAEGSLAAGEMRLPESPQTSARAAAKGG